MIDFSKCKFSDESYNGSVTNLGIIYNNEKCLLKIHDHVSKIEKLKEIDESYYRNNIISEYICCKLLKDIFNENVQEVLLGKYNFYGKYKYYS